MTTAPGPCEFTLRHYRDILAAALAGGFEILALADAARLATGRRQLVLRHDIDFSVEDALRMARCEAALGVRASYAVLLHSPTYSVGDAPTVRRLAEIRSLGHDIALHYDVRFFEETGLDAREGIAREAAMLGALTGGPVVAVSQHRPATHGRAEGLTAGYVDAYSPALTRDIVYVSDSRRGWREACAHDWIARGVSMQLLVHPEWWEADGPRTRRETVARLRDARCGDVAAVMDDYVSGMESSEQSPD